MMFQAMGFFSLSLLHNLMIIYKFSLFLFCYFCLKHLKIPLAVASVYMTLNMSQWFLFLASLSHYIFSSDFCTN